VWGPPSWTITCRSSGKSGWNRPCSFGCSFQGEGILSAVTSTAPLESYPTEFVAKPNSLSSSDVSASNSRAGPDNFHDSFQFPCGERSHEARENTSRLIPESLQERIARGSACIEECSELPCDPNGEVALLFGCSRTIQKITDFALSDMQTVQLVQISLVSYAADRS